MFGHYFSSNVSKQGKIILRKSRYWFNTYFCRATDALVYYFLSFLPMFSGPDRIGCCVYNTCFNFFSFNSHTRPVSRIRHGGRCAALQRYERREWDGGGHMTNEWSTRSLWIMSRSVGFCDARTACTTTHPPCVRPIVYCDLLMMMMGLAQAHALTSRYWLLFLLFVRRPLGILHVI